MINRALDYLNAADVASLPVDTQAGALKRLETVEAKQTAARTAMLGAFTASGGPEADGHGVARTWLRWQTRITRGAAASAVAWMRRLAAHPVIEHALADGEISASWARELCAWTDRLPERVRDDADRLLCQAATDGAGLDDLGRLAEAIYQRTRGPDDDSDEDGFDERSFHLGITFSGAGRAQGDLSPGCAAALLAVLEALGKKAGPEDTRTAAQRRHDALEDACRRLIATGTLPARAGQPTQVQVHLGLAELRDQPGAAATEDAWITGRTGDGTDDGTGDGTDDGTGDRGTGHRGTGGRPARRGGPGWLTGAEAQAAACDATIVPVVTGHADGTALGQLIDVFAVAHSLAHPAPPATRCGCRCGGCTCPAQPTLRPAARRRLARALLGLAIDAVSGPGGLAAALRAQLAGTEPALATPLTSISLPLDIGAGSEAIPAHLRRTVTLRHPGCAFPGCDQPASVCDIHHLVPRSAGGVTALHNLVPLCRFHHLIAIHHWGWTLRLHPDGTTTATSPDGNRIWHSHAPPGQAA